MTVITSFLNNPDIRVDLLPWGMIPCLESIQYCHLHKPALFSSSLHHLPRSWSLTKPHSYWRSAGYDSVTSVGYVLKLFWHLVIRLYKWINKTNSCEMEQEYLSVRLLSLWWRWRMKVKCFESVIVLCVWMSVRWRCRGPLKDEFTWLLFLVPRDPQVIFSIPLFLSFWKPFWRKEKQPSHPEPPPLSFSPLSGDEISIYCVLSYTDLQLVVVFAKAGIAVIIALTYDLGFTGLSWFSWSPSQAKLLFIWFIWSTSWSPKMTNAQSLSKSNKQTSLARIGLVLLTTLGWFKLEMCKTTDSHNGLDLGVDLDHFFRGRLLFKDFWVGSFCKCFWNIFFTKL